MKRILIATLIGLSALATGCTDTPGNPTPTPTTGASTPTSDAGNASGLDSVKPCDLLTSSDASALGLTVPGEPEKVGVSDGCSWRVSGNGGLRAGIRTDAGVKDLNIEGSKVYEIKVGKYTATKVEAHNGAKPTCSIFIGVTEKSSISVLATLKLTSEDTAAACERATKAADLIAPKLP